MSLRIRPHWTTGPPPSTRAAELLAAEWVDLGLVPTTRDAYTELQARAANTPATIREPVPLVTVADTGRPAAPGHYPTFTGRLLTYGEQALIGVDDHGRRVYERFTPGAITLPQPVPVNRSHRRDTDMGRITTIRDHQTELRCTGYLVDTVRDGAEAIELARADVASRLSIEFVPVDFRTHDQPDGSRLIEHTRVHFHGVGFVPLGAYPSATLLRLLDRTETGRQTEHDRQHAIRHLRALTG